MAKVKMINSLFGNVMWVTEDRVEEYKAAGHKLAAPAFKPKEEETEEKGLVKELKEEKKNNKRK